MKHKKYPKKLVKFSVCVHEWIFVLLQELTSWATAGVEEVKDKEEADVSSMTLLEVEQQMLGRAERQAHKLALLQVLAVMVESLQHSQLLRQTAQVRAERQSERFRLKKDEHDAETAKCWYKGTSLSKTSSLIKG